MCFGKLNICLAQNATAISRGTFSVILWLFCLDYRLSSSSIKMPTIGVVIAQEWWLKESCIFRALGYTATTEQWKWTIWLYSITTCCFTPIVVAFVWIQVIATFGEFWLCPPWNMLRENWHATVFLDSLNHAGPYLGAEYGVTTNGVKCTTLNTNEWDWRNIRWL